MHLLYHSTDFATCTHWEDDLACLEGTLVLKSKMAAKMAAFIAQYRKRHILVTPELILMILVSMMSLFKVLSRLVNSWKDLGINFTLYRPRSRLCNRTCAENVIYYNLDI